MSVTGTKRTNFITAVMSAYDPSPTLSDLIWQSVFARRWDRMQLVGTIPCTATKQTTWL